MNIKKLQQNAIQLKNLSNVLTDRERKIVESEKKDYERVLALRKKMCGYGANSPWFRNIKLKLIKNLT